jgi:hypothetical protein
MNCKYLAFTPLIGFLFSAAVSAETFEGAGVVQQVQLDKYLIEVNEKLYSLPLSVADRINPSISAEVESLPTSGQAAIFQLYAGARIRFSGVLASPYPIIDIIEVESNPVRFLRKVQVHE